MCNLVNGSVTFTGPTGALRELESIWHTFTTTREMDLHPPVLQSFDRLESERPFHEGSPGVARLRHQWENDAPVAERLQVEVIMRQLPIFVEPEHHVGLAGAGIVAGQPQPTVTIHNGAVGVATTNAQVGSAYGPRVAVVDSGDMLGKSQMADFTGVIAAYTAAQDLLGHGTSVAELIRQVNNNADVSALRVVNSHKGTSYELLCAMTYAIWSEMFDVVNVSLSAQSNSTCMTVLGGSLTMALGLCQQNQIKLPIIVAAAGNTTTGQSFGYPARLPGTTVVQAWDFLGAPAAYNVAVPSSHQPVYATGGDANFNFGTITHTSGATESMFGTSYAAAVATALLVP